ncbi:10993_t:CDS:2, partial [Ambispora gerdemannii]
MPRIDPSGLSDSQHAKKASHCIDSLRRLGALHAVDLPTVVFCGNHSAGKSSLLKAISDSTCTRCVMEMESKESWQCQLKLRKEYDDYGDEKLSRPLEFEFGSLINDTTDVEHMARRAQKALNLKENWTKYSGDQ